MTSRTIIRFLFKCCLNLIPISYLQAQDIAPQIWNNASFNWNINDRFALRNTLAYNVLLSEEFPWNEITFSTNGVYIFQKHLEASLGLYLASTNQSVNLSSFETRPYHGFRVFLFE